MKLYSEFYGDWINANHAIGSILIGDHDVKKTILDQAEKEYLSGVIKPFRDKVSYICKKKSDCNKMEWIQIGIETDINLDFPSFEIGTMYQGMEVDKEYSLKDLEL